MATQPYTEAKAKANQRWDDAHKQQKNYLNSRSSARSFIRKKATSEDLDELESLIATRRKELSGQLGH